MHITANILSGAKKRHKGRPRLFGREALRKTRYAVERFFSWIKFFRRIDSRYNRLACSFMGFIRMACILIPMTDVLG